MPVTFKVWIEIERCDTDRDEYKNLAEPQATEVAEFTDLDEAITFAERLQGTGEQLSKEHDTEGEETDDDQVHSE